MAGASPGVVLRPRFPGCPRAKEEARGPRPGSHLSETYRTRASGVVGHARRPAVIQLAIVVARSVVMIGVAAFAILVLLPTAVARQAMIPI